MTRAPLEADLPPLRIMCMQCRAMFTRPPESKCRRLKTCSPACANARRYRIDREHRKAARA